MKRSLPIAAILVTVASGAAAQNLFELRKDGPASLRLQRRQSLG